MSDLGSHLPIPGLVVQRLMAQSISTITKWNKQIINIAYKAKRDKQKVRSSALPQQTIARLSFIRYKKSKTILT